MSAEREQFHTIWLHAHLLKTCNKSFFYRVCIPDKFLYILSTNPSPFYSALKVNPTVNNTKHSLCMSSLIVPVMCSSVLPEAVLPVSFQNINMPDFHHLVDIQ